MRRSIAPFLVTLFAAPLLLVSSAALAGPSAASCKNAELIAGGSCTLEVSGGCETDCTPLKFVAACDGQCTVSASADCTGSCTASCETECTANPPSFDCATSCTTSCDAGCMTSCTDSGCQAQCQASCSNRCSVQCTATPPSADCKTKCAASCDADCTVQANASCSVMCSASLQGGCTTQCQTPKGALFCDGQYVDATTTLDDCITYLGNQGFNVQVNATCDANGCAASVTTCSAGPAVGAAARDGLGVGAIAGMMIGLGLVVSRRRRRPS